MVWEKGEYNAFVLGLTLSEYWDMTPKQFEKYFNAYNKRQALALKQADLVAYLNGKYSSFAFNAPKKYPSKPYLQDAELEPKKTVGNEVMTISEMERIMRANTIKLGGTINNGK